MVFNDRLSTNRPTQVTLKVDELTIHLDINKHTITSAFFFYKSDKDTV